MRNKSKQCLSLENNTKEWLPSRLGLENTPTASLLRGNIPHNQCPAYNTKEYDGEVPIMLELGGMQSTPSMPSLPSTFWLGVVASGRVLFMGQI